MKRQTKPAIAETPPRGGHAPVRSVASRLWRRMPTIVKITLTVPFVMALLGAEIELRLAPQLDVILTAAGVCTMWTWLSAASQPLA